MAAATNSMLEVEKLYKAYYGRAADQEGAAYWTAKLDAAGGDASKIAAEFAHSPESNSLYGGLGDSAKVDKIYEQVFGRHADASGLDFYVAKLQAGEMTADTIMLNVLDGAKSDDLAKIDSDVNDAIGKLDQSKFDSLVEQYKATLHSETATDHSGTSGSGGSATDQTLQTHAETQDHITLVGVSDGTHPADPLSV